jgi:AcrR family transcriptional regulator
MLHSTADRFAFNQTFDYNLAMKCGTKTDTSTTRNRLIGAAIESFGRRGFDGTSIRDIARAAGVNIAGIAYHFGGKDQLYGACLKHIAQTMRQGLATRLAAEQDALDQAQAREALKATLFAITQFILATPEIASFVRIVVREQLDPSPAFDILYGDFMEPLHKRLCALWALATQGKPESEATKIAVFGLLGQVLVFRIARAGALRRMGWRDVGERELKALRKRIAINVDLLTKATPGDRE